jgi:hypothetical protein
VLDGEGERQARYNAHGDENYSWLVYLREMIDKKAKSNDLNFNRPNIVMVNSLGIDFQLSLNKNSKQKLDLPDLPYSLDEVWISACSIHGKLESCPNVLKLLRNGYIGSGF